MPGGGGLDLLLQLLHIALRALHVRVLGAVPLLEHREVAPGVVQIIPRPGHPAVAPGVLRQQLSLQLALAPQGLLQLGVLVQKVSVPLAGA